MKVARTLLVSALAALSLGGCVTVLPKQKPVALYRFDASAPSGPALARNLSLSLDRISLAPAADGDGILTVRGDQAAYIGGARWVSPASLLLRDALASGLHQRITGLRIAGAGEAADARLTVRLRRFEVVLATRGDPRGPHILIDGEASLLRSGAGARTVSRLIHIETPAEAERVGAFVGAYDKAVGALCDTLADLVASGG
jgi:cholesterol transport system auxiliary component